MEMSSANYCPHCGAAAEADTLFCPSCSRPIVGGSESAAPVPYLISPARIVLLSILSSGLYNIYWIYKTWQHYRDHTGAEAYPIWHGLTQLVPFYMIAIFLDHMRAFRRLAEQAGVESRITVGWYLAAVLTSWILSGFGFIPWVGLFLTVVGIALVIWMTIHAQTSINYYWDQMYSARLRSVAVGKGEVIVSILGVILWLLTLAGLFVSPDMGQN